MRIYSTANRSTSVAVLSLNYATNSHKQTQTVWSVFKEFAPPPPPPPTPPKTDRASHRAPGGAKNVLYTTKKCGLTK